MEVLIFGYGSRVKNQIIPALNSVYSNIEITVLNKTSSIKQQNKNITLDNFDHLNEYINKEFSFIIVSVPFKNVKVVLKKLLHKKKQTFFIDTPVNKFTKKIIKNNNVYVLEDIVFVEWINVLKQYLKYLNKISIYFYYSAHEYHGIAMIKAIIDKKLKSVKRHYIYPNLISSELNFEENIYVKVLSPSNYDKGFILIRSEKYDLLIGNKETYFNSDIHIKNRLIVLEEEINNLNLNSTNWIKDLSEFKYRGLIELFNNYKMKNYNLPNFNSSKTEQNIAKKNRLIIKILKLINKFKIK